MTLNINLAEYDLYAAMNVQFVLWKITIVILLSHRCQQVMMTVRSLVVKTWDIIEYLYYCYVDCGALKMTGFDRQRVCL
jgi:hypothetical protein